LDMLAFPEVFGGRASMIAVEAIILTR
jgi:hypothetical protein